MTNKTKTIVGVLALAGVGYWIYTRNKAGKSLNPFAKSSSFTGSDNFFNASGRTNRRRATTLVMAGDEGVACSNGCTKGGEHDGTCYTIVPDTDVTRAAGIAGQKAYRAC